MVTMAYPWHSRHLSPGELNAWVTPPPGARASKADGMHLLVALSGLSRMKVLSDGITVGMGNRWRIRAALRRLWRGEPLAYLIGTQPFGDMELAVDPRVLIPRPETEDLSALVKPHLKPGMRVLDVGTGSGCLAIDLKRFLPSLVVEGLDVSRGAVVVARGNAERILGPGHGIRFQTRDFTRESGWPKLGKFEVLVSNPPYVGEDERGEMDGSVLSHEPHRALFAGRDGLQFIRVIARAIPVLLENSGQVFLEVGHRHGPQAVEILSKTTSFHYSIMADHRGVGRLIHGWKT